MRAAASLFAAIVFAAASAASAADLTWTYTASMSTTNGLTDGGITISPSYNWKTTSYFRYASNLLQIGKTGQNVISITYDFSVFPSKIKSIAVTGKTASGNSGATMVSATIGGENFMGSTSLTNGVGTIVLLAPDGPQTGTLSLVIDNPNGGSDSIASQAVYLSSIVVTYEDPDAADPWKPVWTVGTPTPAPRVETVFSFGVSAALPDDTPQTVAFDGLTPVPTGARPTFANGVFSWTPGADASGDYVAAFSVQNDGGTYSTNVAFTVKGETEEDEIFFEGFSGIKGTWNGARFLDAEGDVSTGLTDMDTWHGAKLYNAPSALRFGNGSNHGWSISPLIPLKNGAQSAVVTVSFDACALQSTSTTIKFSVLDANGNAITGFAEQTLTLPILSLSGDQTTLAQGLADANESGLSFTFTAPGYFRLKFDASLNDNSNVAIDSVKVTQKVSTSLVDLDVPTGLAVVDGTLSTNSFSVAWNTVENATNYAVEVRFTGGTDAVASQNLAVPPAVFTALADDVSYEVRLRAEGDTSVYNFSNWTNITVKTVRSPTHATLSFDGWTNAVGNGKLYAGIKNTATVSAVRDDGTNAVVTFTGVSPEPAAGFEPAFENGVLTWTPADENTNTIFTVFFLMDGVYSTNFSFKLQALDPLSPPVVTVAEPVPWNKIDLSWNHQYRAAGYAVRVWTDCPNPGATATRVEENFKGYFKKNGGGARPVGWLFDVAKDGYNNSTTPVKLDESGSWIASYDLGGAITSVTFTVQGNTMKEGSTLRAYWTGALTDEELENPDNRTNNVVVAVTDLVSHSQTVTAQIPANYEARRIVWQYEKHYGTVGVGSVVIEGEGFSTPRWLPGWGPVAKDLGLVPGCTVKKPRPGKALGVNPANKKEDLVEPRANYAEVTVRDAAGATLATVVAVEVPAPPRSARASMMILR